MRAFFWIFQLCGAVLENLGLSFLFYAGIFYDHLAAFWNASLVSEIEHWRQLLIFFKVKMQSVSNFSGAPWVSFLKQFGKA